MITAYLAESSSFAFILTHFFLLLSSPMPYTLSFWNVMKNLFFLIDYSEKPQINLFMEKYIINVCIHLIKWYNFLREIKKLPWPLSVGSTQRLMQVNWHLHVRHIVSTATMLLYTIFGISSINNNISACVGLNLRMHFLISLQKKYLEGNLYATS